MDPPSEGAECMLVAVDGKQIGYKRFPTFRWHGCVDLQTTIANPNWV